MPTRAVIRSADEATPAWLSRVLNDEVLGVGVRPSSGNWSNQAILDVRLRSGATRALRLKVCLGRTFGRSEVDYYTQDYVGLVDAPLLPCLDAQYDPAVGYHLLLQDLSATHDDRRDAPPTSAHGQALARALGRMHRHHWQSGPAPAVDAIDRYLDEVRPGVAAMEQATGQPQRARFELHEQAFRARWASPLGMALLHGDVNPTNVLTPRGAESPVWLLDRQPFDWSLTYGLALSDLAYALVPWWPEETLRDCEEAVLRAWFEAVEPPGYDWAQVLADWQLSVAQCMNVPLEWCSKTDTLTRMRWLWEAQYQRIRAALARCGDRAD